LAKQGVTAEIIDSDPEWKVYGAGITITGPTLRAFRDLGLLDAIAAQGFLSNGAHFMLFNGNLLATQEPLPIEPGLPAAGGIMRPRLHQIMSDEVRRLGITVRLGLTVARLDQDESGVDVAFSDGSSGRYDLVIGADGIYSQTRGMLFPAAMQPEYTGQMSWRVVAPRPPEMDYNEFYFGHRHIGGINPCSQDEVYAFILNPEPEPSRVADADKPAVLKELLKDFGGFLGEIRDGLGPQSSIVQRPFEYAMQPKPWHVGRVVLIGDAVHATTAHLASGAGIAVEDALVLADELAKCGGDVGRGLIAYTERRFERCRFVVESSVAICKRQLENAPAEEIGKRMGEAMHYLAGPI
jgi:2-polyprenyl-6-methoxyphenol hydroxylase-like FAD-dependent oxidoreductase